MQLISLGLATGVTLLALVTHVTIGTRQNAAPILDNNALPHAPRTTLTFSWQANSVLMAFMTAAFGAGLWADMTPLVRYNALLAGGLALCAAGVAFQSGANPFKFPPVPLFGCIATLGICSVIF